MTPKQITVPKQTWDAMLEALEILVKEATIKWDVPESFPQIVVARAALTAAKAVRVEPELVAIEGMPQGLGNEPEILAQWDKVKADAEGEYGKRQWHSVGAWLYEGDAIAVISDAVSHQKPETTPAPEDCAITAESALELLVKEMRYIATITNGQAHRIAMMTLEKVAAARSVQPQAQGDAICPPCNQKCNQGRDCPKRK